MPRNPLTINPANEGKLSLEFSKESLSEFVFSLLATPRQERIVFKDGFDLTLADTKILIDKVSHKIKTDHDILHNEFTADIIFENEGRLTLNSYDQLFSISENRSENISEFSMTLSVVIPFNRKENEKSFEKQTIFILVKAGILGSIETEIRSTEITWPAGYFSLIDQHCKKLAQDIRPPISRNWDYFFFLHPLYLDDTTEKSKSRVSADNARLLSVFAVLFFLTSMLLIFDQTLRITSSSAIFNEETQLIEETNASELIQELGWEKTVSKIRDSQTLSRLGLAKYADGSGPQTLHSKLLNIFYSKSIIGIGVGLFVLLFSNFCYAKVRAAARIGRIFLFTDKLPHRSKGTFLWGILGSLAIGVLGSMFATLIIGI